MKKIFLILIIFVMVTAGLFAQNIFFAAKKGMTLTYVNNDANGNPNSYDVLTIKEVKGSGQNMTITYAMKSLDKDKKPLKEGPTEKTFQVVIKDGIMYRDINEMVPSNINQGELKVEISGSPMELPGNLQPGQKLKDSEVTINVDMGIMKIDTVVKITNGECLAIEDVTVPAGTFKCHKISQTASATAMKLETVTKTFSWYASGIGSVKAEIYDSKNKLMGSKVLIEVKGR